MSYPEAVSYLLDGEQGQIIERGKRQETKRKQRQEAIKTAGCRKKNRQRKEKNQKSQRN